MRLVERALDQSFIAWASLMVASMCEKLGHYVGGTSTFFFGLMLVAFLFDHFPSSWPPKVVEEIGS